ncbi:hypothetical protein Mapa_003087 [Marchantia paleacea]|nr:hypothetical protein Mapa_003087 [Marchantia paleacea]
MILLSTISPGKPTLCSRQLDKEQRGQNWAVVILHTTLRGLLFSYAFVSITTVQWSSLR